MLESESPGAEGGCDDSEGVHAAGSGDAGEGTVCLVQAVRLPARHAKLVRAKVTGKEGYSLTCFEPDLEELGTKGLVMSEAAVELDEGNCVVMVLENHTLEPVEVEEGLVLGRVQEAKIPGEPEEESSGVVAAVMPDDFTEARLQ